MPKHAKKLGHSERKISHYAPARKIEKVREDMFANYEGIRERIEFLENEIKRVQELQKKFPEGNLICSRNNERYKWYLRNKKSIAYLPKKEQKLAQKLAIKKYYQLYESELGDELLACRKYIQGCKNKGNSLEKFFSNDEYMRLIGNQIIPMGQELKEWAESDYERNGKYPENLVVKGVGGKYLRSKAEAFIDKLLFQHGIPYHYEEKIILGGIALYPDFTIRHPRTGEYFYWEHFGMMDSLEYVNKVCKKMKLYCDGGIYPSINLITTYETKDHPLGVECIENVIKEFFLQ